MAAGNHTLGTIRGTIEIDYDGAGIVKAVRDTDKTKKSFGSLDGASSKVLAGFGKFAGGAAKVAAGLNIVANAGSLVASTLAVVGPLAAAGLAAAPGVILAYASAMGIAKIATAGVGDALAAAGEDGKKFDEALKKLSPEAQKFAKSFKAAYPQIQGIKTAIQDAFFRGTAGKVGGVVKTIQSLTVPAAGVARALSQVAQNVIKFATSGKSIASIKNLLSGVRLFLYQIKDAVGPVVQAFLGLAGQAGAFGETLGTKVANALLAFANFLNSINLKAIFAAALPILQQLGGLLSTVGSILSSVFSGLSTDGASVVGILGEMATQLATFLKSAQGQDALAALGQALQAVSGAAGQIFLALLQALAPAIVALAPGVTTLANQISGLLVPTINALNPLLTALAGFLSENMGWIGPLAGAVVGLAAAYKIYAAGAKAVAAVQALIASKAVVSTGAWIANTAAIVANRVAGLAVASLMLGQVVAAWVANTAAIIANRVATVAATVASVAVRAATIAWTAVQWLLNAALSANPIGLVVLAIAALVAGLIYAYQHSETFRNIVQAVWAAIKASIMPVVSWITGTVWPAIVNAWNVIVAATKVLWNMIREAWASIKAGIQSANNTIKNIIQAVWLGIVTVVKGYINIYKTVITAAFNAVRAVITSVMNGVRAVVSAVWSAITSVVRSNVNAVKTIITGIKVIVTTIRNAFNSAKSAVSSGIGAIVSLVRGLPGRVSGALGSLGSLLYSKGQALIRGFINGIGSMIGAVKDKVSSVVGAVTRFLPGSPAKEGPLSGKGYVLLRARRFMNDFAQGLQDGSQKPVAALYGAVNPVARAVVPSTSRTTSGASSAPSTPVTTGGQRVYRVAIGDKDFADLVVDAITGEPVAVSKAANEGSRKTSWSGSGR